MYDTYKQHAALCDEFDLTARNLCCVTVGRHAEPWPFLVVAQTFEPAGAGFEPGALLLEETNRLFIGAGERILCYDLCSPRRLWVDSADTGFWGWTTSANVVLMSAELEFAAWTDSGEKLWTTFVEPPWEFAIDGSTVVLDVMGSKKRFDVREGPNPDLHR